MNIYSTPTIITEFYCKKEFKSMGGDFFTLSPLRIVPEKVHQT